MYNPLSLDSKKILITGASAGIGKSCAIVLAKLGAQIILSSRNENRLKAVADKLPGIGHKVAPCDFSNFNEIPELLSFISEKIGPLDGLVHSAGVQLTLPIKATTLKRYKELMNVNLDAAYLLAKSFRRKGVYQSPASLVFISSIAGMAGIAGLSAYSASKAGLLGLTRSLAIELARDEIRVNCISPGYIETEMMKNFLKTQTQEQITLLKSQYPIGLGCPKDIAHGVAYLVSSAGRWITGINLPIDGGYTAR